MGRGGSDDGLKQGYEDEGILSKIPEEHEVGSQNRSAPGREDHAVITASPSQHPIGLSDAVQHHGGAE